MKTAEADKMRMKALMLAALWLTACTPAVPDSGAGVGFQSYDSYLDSRTALQPPAPLPGFSTDGAAAAIANAENGGTVQPLPAAQQDLPLATGTARARGNAPAGIVETTAEMDAVGGVAQSGVSDEQDFAAVSARETIESDKARIDSNRAKYQVDQPGALPERSGTSGPNIVEFAISTSHPVGAQMFKRSKIGVTNATKACAKFPSPDIAQEAFLAAGGPDKDRKGLDPDGDGYACSWDPAPFRTALN